MAEQFPISATEAQLISDAMTPIQNLTGVGSSVGNALEDVPGAGPALVGSVLQNVATQVELASQSAEMVANIIDFYVKAQGGAVEELFPPPDVLAKDIRQQTGIIRNAFEPPQR